MHPGRRAVACRPVAVVLITRKRTFNGHAKLRRIESEGGFAAHLVQRLSLLAACGPGQGGDG